MALTPIQRRACPGLWPTHNMSAFRVRTFTLSRLGKSPDESTSRDGFCTQHPRCRGTSLTRRRRALGTYRRIMPRALDNPRRVAFSYERGTPCTQGLEWSLRAQLCSHFGANLAQHSPYMTVLCPSLSRVYSRANACVVLLFRSKVDIFLPHTSPLGSSRSRHRRTPEIVL